jgi:hypothetical protein
MNIAKHVEQRSALSAPHVITLTDPRHGFAEDAALLSAQAYLCRFVSLGITS